MFGNPTLDLCLVIGIIAAIYLGVRFGLPWLVASGPKTACRVIQIDKRDAGEDPIPTMRVLVEIDGQRRSVNVPRFDLPEDALPCDGYLSNYRPFDDSGGMATGLVPA